MPFRIRRAVFACLAAACAAVPAAAQTVELFTRPALPKAARVAPGHLVGTTPVEFDVRALAAMAPGEVATMGLPNGQRYEVVLDRLDRHPDGDLSWIGHVRVPGRDPRDTPVIVTLGGSGTYANFTLPDGQWGVVPGEGIDWLFDAEFSGLYVDRSEATDARIPPKLAAPDTKADADCPAVTTLPTPQRNIDVLFVMAPDFVGAHGGAAGASTRINNLLGSINTFYANSKIAITLRRAGAVNVTYPSAASQSACGGSNEPDACDGKALDNITDSVGVFANIPLLRDLYGADMVAFMRGPRMGNGISGVAWVGGYQQSPIASSSGYMYSVNGDAPGFSATLMAHEIGHNMGNHHDPANAGTTAQGATSWGYGYTRCGTGASAGCPSNGGFNSAGAGGFGTIMSYWRPTISRFSNPNDTCSGNGSPVVACGGTIGSASPPFSALTDEVRTINCTRNGISAMRAPHVLDCANPKLDTDGDGVPNCVEQALGLANGAKDNDIFQGTRRSSLLFASQQFRDFLGREADADGNNFWTGALAGGTYGRAQMIEGFFNSAEFQGVVAPMARLYFAYFLRIPDYAGLQHWIGQYRAGVPLEAISQTFASSAEFATRYGALDNAQFVSLVYQNVLGRAPDGTGLAFWTGQLAGGFTRGQMMASFSESAEYRGVIGSEVFVTMIYTGMLRRAPDQGGFDFWVASLDGGAPGLGLINGFLGSAEYRGRFLP